MVRRPLPPSGKVTVAAGEMIVSVCTGGGGYGSPLEREPERVREDVAEGWISRERARDVYGVVVTEDGDVDAGATAALRSLTTSAPGTPR